MLPDNVHPAAMHEHRREDGDPVPAGDNISGNHRPLFYKCIATNQFQENEHVHDDDR